MSLRSPLDSNEDDDLGPLAAKLPSPKKATKPKKEASKAQPEAEVTDEEVTPDGEQAADPPPNGGGQVPPQAGTHVGTSPGTQVGRKEEASQEEGQADETESSLDFSMRGALAGRKDPEQDWVKSGWQALKYRKAAVETAVKFKWRGYTEQQELVDAALDAFIPKDLSDTARDMARRGEL